MMKLLLQLQKIQSVLLIMTPLTEKAPIGWKSSLNIRNFYTFQTKKKRNKKRKEEKKGRRGKRREGEGEGRQIERGRGERRKEKKNVAGAWDGHVHYYV